MYKDIEDLIENSKKSAEIKRGLAVKQDLALKNRKVIGEILDVTVAFISKWRLIYDAYGVDALMSYHKGGSPRSFLTEGQRASVIAHIQAHDVFSPKDLAVYLKSTYDISYKSGQSYYELLHEAKMSYHKSQKINPRRDESKIATRREEIKKKLRENRKAIKRGKIVVLFEDECHVKHGDSLGYVWGKRNERVGVRMLNERDSKTFFGVLDLQTHKFHLKEYAWANMESTVDFLKYLLEQFKIAKQLIIIWDGASFHKGALVQQFLDSVNKGLEPKDWKIHCLLFAPNAPEQNPVEDCWLKAKNYMRENILKNLSFKDSINAFKEAFNNLTFDFGKLNWYF